MSEKTNNEISHGKKILEKAELVWGWGTFAGRKRARRRADFFIEYAKMTKGKKILELGCGTGIFTTELAKTKAHIYAMDISPELIGQAKEKNKKENIEFAVMRAENLNFSDKYFDAAIGSSVLHHLDLEPSLKEIKRVLKSGAPLIFTEPNMLNPQILIQKNIPFIKKIMGDSPDETAFVRWKLKALLKAVGFCNIEIIPFDFLHPLTPKLLVKTLDSFQKILEKTPFIKEIAGSLLIKAAKSQ